MTKTEFRFAPLGDQVIVRPDTVAEAVISGIIIQPSAQADEPTSGTIVAVGKGGTFLNCPDPGAFVKVGQKIWFNQYAGYDLELKETVEGSTKNVKYKVLRLDAIFGIDRESK